MCNHLLHGLSASCLPFVELYASIAQTALDPALRCQGCHWLPKKTILREQALGLAGASEAQEVSCP